MAGDGGSVEEVEGSGDSDDKVAEPVDTDDDDNAAKPSKQFTPMKTKPKAPTSASSQPPPKAKAMPKNYGPRPPAGPPPASSGGFCKVRPSDVAEARRGGLVSEKASLRTWPLAKAQAHDPD